MISDVHNCDCMEFMRDLPDQFFDLCIWDPPYGIDAAKMGMGGTASNRRTARRLYKEHTERKKASFSVGAGKLKDRLLNQSSLDWDSKIPDDAVFEEIFRVSKNQIIWGGNYYDLPPCRCFVAWDKVQPWENFS